MSGFILYIPLNFISLHFFKSAVSTTKVDRAEKMPFSKFGCCYIPTPLVIAHKHYLKNCVCTLSHDINDDRLCGYNMHVSFK